MLQPAASGELATLADAPRDWVFPGGDEIFRGIYTRAGAGFSREVIAVGSAISGEGRTTVSLGLAVAIAEDFPERRVLLVETDSERAVLAADFGVEAEPGLLDCVIGGEPLQNACRPTYLENLHLVPAGRSNGVQGRPLRSSRMAIVIDAMRQMYDVIILDLPPVLANSDSPLLTDVADSTIFVVRSGVTPLTLVNRAIEQLEVSKLRGVVLNGSSSSVPSFLQRLLGVHS
jgi:capsular exopolysaccharide synthesis family protein